jgi:hypothetical protein
MERFYSKTRRCCDILRNKNTGVIFAKIELGVLPPLNIVFEHKDEDTYKVFKKIYTRDNTEKLISLGETFPVKRKDVIVPGKSQTGLSLSTTYDNETKTTKLDKANQLFITTHSCDIVTINDTLEKIGYMTSCFGVEKPEPR